MTNRELATVILICLVLAGSFTRSDVRRAFKKVLQALLNWKVLAVIGSYAAFVAFWVWMASRIELWNCDLLKDTILWFFLTGFPLLFKFDEAGRDKSFFQRTALSTVELAAFFGFFINLVSLSLLGELALQCVLAALVLMRVVTANDSRYEQTRRVIDVFIAAIVVLMSLYSVIRLYQERGSLDAVNLGLSLVMPFWLSLVSLVFLFGFSLFAGYEDAFGRMKYGGKIRQPTFKEKLALVLGLNVHLWDVYAFRPYWAGRIKAASTFRDALSEVQSFRSHVRSLAEQERKEQQRLHAFAGVIGTDEQGKQFDRREFIETQNALRWVATSQMGHYRTREGGYRPDLMEILGDFTTYGLPKDHGIVLTVREDGQAWHAWRRTVPGWIFAIGASSKPSDQWLYDGPEPPSDFPSADSGWDHFAPGNQANNWS